MNNKNLIIILIIVVIISVIIHRFDSKIRSCLLNNATFNVDYKFGKKIYLTIEDNDNVDYKYVEKLRGDDEIITKLTLLEDSVLEELQEYLLNNKFKIKAGNYELSQDMTFEQLENSLDFIDISN